MLNISLRNERRQSLHTKRIRRDSINHQSCICRKFRQRNQIIRTYELLKLRGHHWCIIISKRKRKDRSNISKDRIFNRLIELRSILICNDQREFILSSFWKNRSKWFCSKVLKLINIQIKRLSQMLRHISSSHRINLNLSYQERTNHICIIFSNLSLWKIYQNNLSLIHSPSDTELCSRLSKDISHQTRRKKLTNLVRNWSNRFLSLFILPSIKLIIPKFQQHGILHMRNHFLTKFLICQNSKNMHQCSIWIVDHWQNYISQNIFQSWTSWIIKELLKSRNYPRGNSVFFIFIIRLQKVKPNRIFRISNIKQNHIIDTIWGNILKQIIYQFSMRIQETKPIPSPHIRNNHIIDKGRFSRSGFPYNIHVPKLIFLTNSKSDLIPSIVCISKHG